MAVLLTHSVGRAAAQTPTPVPVECGGSERLQIVWKASTRQAKVLLRMGRCPAPAGCDGGATPLLSAPVTLTLRDATGRTISGPLTVVDYAKNDLCPGGHETFELDLGRLRYVFGSSGATSVVMKAPFFIAEPPLLQAPVSFSLTDASGYALGTALPDCSLRSSDALVRLRCEKSASTGQPTAPPGATSTPKGLPTRTPVPTRTPIPTRTSAP
ncbi:MAG: hypothetical protein SF182_26345 [Deltaproteobacteria bacterium]|nr:hypothetical protein [Deltaproteobacteria bacterium]